MARLVKRFRKLPYVVTVGGETKSMRGKPFYFEK
jgi:hypothetical protein